MVEEIKKRGRQKGDIAKIKQKGYIVINEESRIRVETDSLIWEEVIGKNKETKESIWGGNKYFTSWDGILSFLIRRMTTDKISKKGIISFKEGKQEILYAINECKDILIGEVNKQMKLASDEIKNQIKKFI